MWCWRSSSTFADGAIGCKMVTLTFEHECAFSDRCSTRPENQEQLLVLALQCVAIKYHFLCMKCASRSNGRTFNAVQSLITLNTIETIRTIKSIVSVSLFHAPDTCEIISLLSKFIHTTQGT